MRLSTTNKVSAAFAVALAAVFALGGFAVERFWMEHDSPGIVLVTLLVVSTNVVLLMAARSVRGDLDARTRAERALQASEARMAGIFSIAPDAIITVDESFRIVLFNQGAEHTFGYRESEMLGQELEGLLPARFRSSHRVHMVGFGLSNETARRVSYRREIVGLRKDGKEFSADASIIKLSLDGTTSFTVVMRDITERRRAEESQRFLADAGAVLTRTLATDETLVAIAQLPVPRLADACIVEVLEGESTLRVASVTDDPELNIRLEAVARGRTDLDSPWAVVDVLRTGTTLLVDEVTDEWLEAHAEDDRDLARWRGLGATSAVLVPLVVRGESLGVLTMLSLRAARRFAPADVALMEELASRAAFAIDNAHLLATSRAAARARDDILSVVSHDLRNPVNAIGMCVRALRESAVDDPLARRDLVNAIAEAAEWMDRLIRDLLDVANIERRKLSIERHAEEVRPIVDSAVAMFAATAKARGARLWAQVDPALPAVQGDAARLVQVLSNLIANALAHTPEGGSVTLEAVSGDAEVEFTVRDTGCGIAPEELPRIFERHWRSSASERVSSAENENGGHSSRTTKVAIIRFISPHSPDEFSIFGM